jgi:hypothetical protein
MIAPKLIMLTAAVVPVAIAGMARMEGHAPDPPPERMEVGFPKADRLPLPVLAAIEPTLPTETIPVTVDAPKALVTAIMEEEPHRPRKRSHDVCGGRGKRYFYDRPHHKSWRCRR